MPVFKHPLIHKNNHVGHDEQDCAFIAIDGYQKEMHQLEFNGSRLYGQ